MDKKTEKKQLLEVTVEQAALIGERFDKDQVIIMTWSREHHSECVTTWGRSLVDADQAAMGGNKLKKALGCSDANSNATSARVLLIKDDIQEARSAILDNLGLFGGGEKMNKVMELLNRAVDRIEGTEVKDV